MSQYEQAIILRSDLHLLPGKAISHGMNASNRAAENASERAEQNWCPTREKTILKALDETQVQEVLETATKRDIPTAKSETESNETAAIAIGPADSANLHEVVKNLHRY